MPSNSVLEAKKGTVAEIKSYLENSVAGVIVDYRGITVEQDTKLRAELRDAGVQYKIVKNTLLRFAANEVGLDALDEVLHGPTALAYHESDSIAPAKIIAKFAKTVDALEIKAGYMEGAVIPVSEVMTLANTPSKDELIAKIMGSLNAPVSNLVRLLDTIANGGEEIADLIAKKSA